MKPDDRRKTAADPKRRSFLLAASAGGAGAVAATVASLSPVAPEVQPATPDPEGNGYRVSDHVLHYYRTTRI